MFLKLFFICLQVASGYKIQFLDKISARTTVRLWHDLYVEKKKSHDFLDLLRPQKEQVLYIGAIRLDEIKAIASCRRQNLTQLQLIHIAHAPEEEEAAILLMKQLCKSRDFVDFKSIRKQTRWFYEALYLNESDEST
jgi:hypothetical protein